MVTKTPYIKIWNYFPLIKNAHYKFAITTNCTDQTRCGDSFLTAADVAAVEKKEEVLLSQAVLVIAEEVENCSFHRLAGNEPPLDHLAGTFLV